MPARRSLPLHDQWQSEHDYVSSLLTFACESELFRNLCGGVHVLDFLTREPDLYTTILPTEWRTWFDRVSVNDVLQLLLDINRKNIGASQEWLRNETTTDIPSPPASLVEYIHNVDVHCLTRRAASTSEPVGNMPRHIAVGMKPKKIHEVSRFAAYVDRLTKDLVADTGKSTSIVDFGSGQNYLGRTLACPPYNKNVIAIEQRHHNINGARGMDVHAKLVEKEKMIRNKKEYRKVPAAAENAMVLFPVPAVIDETPGSLSLSTKPQHVSQQPPCPGRASMTYIEHVIEDGHLKGVLSTAKDSVTTVLTETGRDSSHSTPPNSHDDISSHEFNASQRQLMVISLHSCGNLIHHGLRALILNPSVAAVAMIGCCYNLMTERLGPPTYKLPTLRSNHPRLDSTSSAYDPHGFPMSRSLETFQHKAGTGVRLNITARMMAVQAPYNWGPKDSEDFFRRHFYRTLLQKILLDLGVVKKCTNPDSADGNSATAKDTASHPLIVGSLRKHCFTSFKAYVHGALAKLSQDPNDGKRVRAHIADLTDDLIEHYEAQYSYAKKNLSIMWSLMAFSAGVVESIIVVDRWLFLREQECVKECWVEPVFDYKFSPRNLVVVGIKKRGASPG